jgi:hypothetical protein
MVSSVKSGLRLDMLEMFMMLVMFGQVDGVSGFPLPINVIDTFL